MFKQVSAIVDWAGHGWLGFGVFNLGKYCGIDLSQRCGGRSDPQRFLICTKLVLYPCWLPSILKGSLPASEPTEQAGAGDGFERRILFFFLLAATLRTPRSAAFFLVRLKFCRRQKPRIRGETLRPLYRREKMMFSL